MDRRLFHYNILIWGISPFLIATGISALALLLACTDANTPAALRPEVTARYLIWLGGIGATLAAVSIFHPENPLEIEPLATITVSVSNILFSRWLIVVALTTIPAWAALLGAAMLSGRPMFSSWVPGAIAVLSAILLFGGAAFFVSAIGRQSLIGIVVGILLLLIATIIQLPDRIQAISLFRSNEAWIQPGLWWGSRLVYFAVGASLGWHGAMRLSDFDYLLTSGKPRFSLKCKSKTKLAMTNHAPRKPFAFAYAVLPLDSGFLAQAWVYDAWQVLLRGALPTAVLSLVILFCGLAIIGLDWELHLAIDAPRSVMMFGTLIIPLLTCDTIPAERRTGSDQLSLSVRSFPGYLRSKLSANAAVVGVSFAVVILPVIAFYFLTITMNARLSTAALVMWCGIALPYLIYLAAAATLLGALFGGRSGYAVGAILAIGGIILYVLAGEVPVINYIFPCGPAAADTLMGWVQGTPVERLAGQSLAVPLWALVLLPLSAFFQIALLYKMTSAILQRRSA